MEAKKYCPCSLWSRVDGWGEDGGCDGVRTQSPDDRLGCPRHSAGTGDDEVIISILGACSSVLGGFRGKGVAPQTF